MENRTPKIFKALFGDDLGFNNGLHWTTIISEKVLLAIIGALTMVAAVIDLKAVWISQSVSLLDLFLFSSTLRLSAWWVPSTRAGGYLYIAIIIAITALCRTIIGQGKEVEPLLLISAAGAVLILASACLMSLKDKLVPKKRS